MSCCVEMLEEPLNRSNPSSNSGSIKHDYYYRRAQGDNACIQKVDYERTCGIGYCACEGHCAINPTKKNWECLMKQNRFIQLFGFKKFRSVK